MVRKMVGIAGHLSSQFPDRFPEFAGRPGNFFECKFQVLKITEYILRAKISTFWRQRIPSAQYTADFIGIGGYLLHMLNDLRNMFFIPGDQTGAVLYRIS